MKIKIFLAFLLIVTAFTLMLTGCGSKTITPNSKVTSGGEKQKSMPDKMTTVKIATVSNTIDFLPWYVAAKKGMFEKYNLKVDIISVDGGVTALRGLQAGDFKFISSLPESIITSVVEGANVKLIGTLSNQTLFSVFVSPEINKVEDLKGKAVAVLQPGSGVDIIMRWWLKKHGLEPDKDVRIVYSGGTPARLSALINGQVQGTLLQPPNDFNGEKASMKRLAVLNDELKSYNQDVIAANGNVIKDQPEVARAFMSATSEAIAFIKDPANRKEVIQITMASISIDEEIATKSLEFLLKVMPDKGKLNVDGVKWAIDAVKEIGFIKVDLPVEKLIDERFYSEK